MTSELARLSNWDWEHLSSDTRYLTHGIHRYSGKFIPHIARQALEICTAPGDIILDPYCGSGTTLLEALVTGRHAIGVDLSPLAVLISKVKTTPVGLADLAELIHKFESEVKLRTDGQGSLPIKAGQGTELGEVDLDPRINDAWFTKWFAPERLRELVLLDLICQSITDARLRNIATLALSDVLRRSSYANSSYANVMFDKRKKTPGSCLGPFFNRLRYICRRVGDLSENTHGGSSRVLRADAQKLPLPDHSIDAVVTHPPYIGSIPYAEYGVLSLKWLGHDPKHIDRALTGGVRQSKTVVERFEAGYSSMFRESARVLRRGGAMFVLVGSPTVRGQRIDLPGMSTQLAEEHGLRLLDQEHREGGNRRANKMVGEELLLFQRT